ncbi:MAG: acetylornithine deacetylase, partial [Pseudomonadota bacterium]|nr:acetylornithine deacetylase [Pseudomonadota bacterium]
MAQDAVVELLAELVAIDTTSHLSNLPLIAFVEDYLSRHGVDAKRITDHSGHKANLYATIGPPGLPGLMLSGHTDTVPVAGQAWTLDPFVLTEQDGR